MYLNSLSWLLLIFTRLERPGWGGVGTFGFDFGLNKLNINTGRTIADAHEYFDAIRNMPLSVLAEKKKSFYGPVN